MIFRKSINIDNRLDYKGLSPSDSEKCRVPRAFRTMSRRDMKDCARLHQTDLKRIIALKDWVPVTTTPPKGIKEDRH